MVILIFYCYINDIIIFTNLKLVLIEYLQHIEYLKNKSLQLMLL